MLVYYFSVGGEIKDDGVLYQPLVSACKSRIYSYVSLHSNVFVKGEISTHSPSGTSAVRPAVMAAQFQSKRRNRRRRFQPRNLS